MKKVIFVILVLFIFSAVIPSAVYSKDTTAVKVKKTLKKSDKVVVDPTVYIKDNGKKFHRRNCKLVSGKKGIKLSEALKKGYKPCKICFKSETVYVTEKGKKYHKKGCKMVKDLKPMALGIAELKGYTSCKICFPPKKDLKSEIKKK